MNYQFKGNLRGFLCNDCEEFLTGVIIRIFKTTGQNRVTEQAVASVKETFHQLTGYPGLM